MKCPYCRSEAKTNKCPVCKAMIPVKETSTETEGKKFKKESK